MDDLAQRLDAVRARIDRAAHVAGRDPAGITLIAVTKFQPLDVVRRLHALGVTDFGESRHPEARDKALALPDASWHFVGQLQTNKARQVARYADVIHSVDRLELVHALRDQQAGVLLQVDLDGGDPGRGGALPQDVPALAEAVLGADGLRLRGVMAVAPAGEDPARSFARLAACAEVVRALERTATWISAGMSNDLEQAVAAGATHLRIGTALTGPRPAP